MKPKPTNVIADRQKRLLTIQWNDGTSCDYPFDGLRAICPCVSCKGGHSNMGGPPDHQKLYHSPETDLTLEGLQAVGSYALQFNWSDGHWTGIYTWDYLREGCLDRAEGKNL